MRSLLASTSTAFHLPDWNLGAKVSRVGYEGDLTDCEYEMVEPLMAFGQSPKGECIGKT